MTDADADLQQRLLALFAEESRERLDAIARGLLELEATMDDALRRETIEAVFREVHSLKGASRSVCLTEIERCCQGLEDEFASLRKGEHDLDATRLDPLHEVVRDIEAHVQAALGGDNSGPRPPTPPPARATADPPVVLTDQAAPAVPSMPPVAPATPAGPEEPLTVPAAVMPAGGAPAVPAARTLRVDAGRLDHLMLQAEELLQVKLALAQREDEVRVLAERAAAGHDRIPRELAKGLSQLRTAVGNDRRVAASLVDQLLEQAKQSLMQPFSTITIGLQRAARDLARDGGKEVRCTVEGDDVEIDKRLLDGLYDPLLHVLRNCVDHGIESPEERVAAGKPAAGSVRLAIGRVAAGTVEIVVADDGRGVDTARLRESAVRKGRIDAEEAAKLSEEEALQLAFASEVSTSPILTTISGRGLGMAIVRSAAEGFGGTAELTSEPGVGACCRLQVPVTVSTYHGTLVEAGGERFVLPTRDLVRVLRVRREQVQMAEGRPVVSVDGRATALAHLADVLGLKQDARDGGTMLQVVVVRSAAGSVALAVDAVLRDQEILTKSLGPQLLKVPNVSSAAAMQDGSLALVLSVEELVQTVAGGQVAFTDDRDEQAEASPAAMRVLLAEDSITARTLLQGILESAGYTVLTAVDGADAYATLRTEPVAAVVSDVDMPRMNGFALTERIRADEETRHLPVVLVTARETPEDREHGIQVGADAYISKSTFEQTHLLEVMERLM